ncbi:MAG TPA: NADH-quinone oxidoreductase subunit NuoK [Armatimonadetes bacterium]|nr:NADH-quinone oxidoreductase subunit NuoK [Armatimonadota bacterium]
MVISVAASTNLVLALSAILFSIGVLGVLLRRHVLIIYMSIELMLNAANLAFIAFGRLQGTIDGQIAVFFTLTVAAAEVAVGLGIVVVVYRELKSLDIDRLNLLKF